MSKLIYIDTNVYIDYFDERSYGFRPANEFAFILIKRAMSCEFKLVFSDHLLKELTKHIHKDKVFDLLDLLKTKDKIVKINTTNGVKRLASEISRSKLIHYADALHYALALTIHAEAIITNDKEFLNINSEDIIIMFPNDI